MGEAKAGPRGEPVACLRRRLSPREGIPRPIFGYPVGRGWLAGARLRLAQGRFRRGWVRLMGIQCGANPRCTRYSRCGTCSDQNRGPKSTDQALGAKRGWTPGGRLARSIDASIQANDRRDQSSSPPHTDKHAQDMHGCEVGLGCRRGIHVVSGGVLRAWHVSSPVVFPKGLFVS